MYSIEANQNVLKYFYAHGIEERDYILFLAGVCVQQTILSTHFELLDLQLHGYLICIYLVGRAFYLYPGLQIRSYQKIIFLISQAKHVGIQ